MRIEGKIALVTGASRGIGLCEGGRLANGFNVGRFITHVFGLRVGVTHV